jgi:hypothetical protein
LYSFERIMCALDVLFVVIPFCCFFGEAAVIDGLVGHGDSMGRDVAEFWQGRGL